MKHFLTYPLIVILASLCSKGEIPTPPNPVPPADDVTAPKIIMNVNKSDCILAQYFPEVVFPFTIENADKYTVVEITEENGVDTKLTLANDRLSGSVSVKANSQFSDDAFLVLRVTKEKKSDQMRIDFEKAFVTVASVGEGFTYDASRKELTCDMKALDKVAMELQTNIDIDVDYPNLKVDWFNAVADSENKNTILLSVAMNFSEENKRKTSFSITNSNRIATLLTINVTQDKDADRIAKERNALMAIYKSLNGDNWRRAHGMTNQTGVNAAVDYWGTDMPLFRWYGVDVNNEGHVSVLDLSHFGVEGTLPDDIGELIYCRTLDICSNVWNNSGWAKEEGRERYLYGQLPKGMANMRSLHEVYLSGNHLEGDLESSPLKELVKGGLIGVLSLEHNNFTGNCPEWLADIEDKWWYNYGHYSNWWIGSNRLSGKVPERVKNLPFWNEPYTGIGDWKTVGEYNMTQQEGYGLWE